MLEDNTRAIRERNVALASKIMNDFGRNMDGWYDHLHADIVMEFPFGSAVGMPELFEGKEACSGLFAAVDQGICVKFHDIRIYEMADPNQLLLEFQGHGDPEAGPYDQKYIVIQEYKDGKLIKYREYWNSKVVFDLFGDLSALGA